ncbi:catalytic domain of components of various dehydrogenase complexes [Rippkaea orientalis PCC 8801]|uniref:Dihydrolipoamide acetyltransferase component of pyruvate dehydrogenase complex n=1 Tax=Rippkaea orientalis (strain PCC 8801 / RF-1) TaxID=41431 RepID=B7K3F5_RIPO1|nr:dihydrolipoamide acetyltransferase family protein [Rippkaea orientalis]ACK65297.1 catalytic domain of components of various dehydrogenase complexes [Rippkaea orientalis PCC 8801]
MIHDIFMPALSSTMTEGKIVSWVKSPGDKVAKGETVVVVESDKADMDVESFYEGYLATILVEAGQEAPVGTAIALIAETEAEITQAQQQQKPPSATAEPSRETTSPPVASPQPVPTVTATPTVTASNGNGRTVASPRAKKLAKELGVDLKTLRGSGPYGRIVAGDVERATSKVTTVTPTLTPTPTVQPTPTPSTPPTPVPATPGETVPLTTLQKAVVQNMVATVQVPTYHVGYTITTDALDKLYKQLKSKGVTMTALLAKAVAMAVQKHPLVNASYTDQGIKYNGSINVALAVAMDDGGLITPVLQNADQVDIYSLSRTWKDLVDRARSKQLQPQEYNSGTITVSNLGMFGVDRFDAILPPGQGAILAIGASRPQVVATPDGLIGVQRQMAVNITCDHRVIYGAHAAAFLQDLAKVIETDVQSLTM